MPKTLTRIQFGILTALIKEPDASQRALAEFVGCSLGSINKGLKELAKAGYLDNSNAFTQAGYQALEPYKVDNAVIMAAGLSSRFAPISYEKPKGLLEVKGEILIERQIRQLQEAGITDIIVVLGYKREYFFYLEEKFGVTLVENPYFSQRNNNSSLYVVKDKLRNSYICSSDVYLSENPFEPYVYKAYYSSIFAAGATDEWCLSTSPAGRITGVEVGGENSWIMLGHVYFDRAFSERFCKILTNEFENPLTYPKLWEEIYQDHLHELDMEIKKYEHNIIHEFDSLDELRQFDPLFLRNLDLDVFKHIQQVLDVDAHDITQIYPLKQGLTNLSCHFNTPKGEFVYRHPGAGTEVLVNRGAECQAQKIAADLGIDNTFVYEDPKQGWKITRFISSARTLDGKNAVERQKALQLIKRLHEVNARIDFEFDFFVQALDYETSLLAYGDIEIPEYWEMRAVATKLQAFIESEPNKQPRCVTHNDFYGPNILVNEAGELNLIDWEYAGMSDYAHDLGTFAVCEQLTADEIDQMIAEYFGVTPTPEQYRHCLAYIAAAGWCWYVWALLKRVMGEDVGEWLYIYYRCAKAYLPRALDLYQRA